MVGEAGVVLRDIAIIKTTQTQDEGIANGSSYSRTGRGTAGLAIGRRVINGAARVVSGKPHHPAVGLLVSCPVELVGARFRGAGQLPPDAQCCFKAIVIHVYLGPAPRVRQR
ncbi:hypothetical protein ES703_108360 [subsurface metagenome]